MQHILVCDDEKDIVAALKIYLESDGYCVHTAYSGEEALRVAKTEPVQLALMDIMMPGMDGITQRSSVESLKKDIAGQIENLFALAGAVPAHGDGYPGWKPNLKSPLLDVAVKAYEELYDVTPAVKAIHAGLECGLFLEKNPGLHMISFGPTLRGVHSPDEKMHIPAVEKFWNHLTLILKKLAGH